LECTLKACIAQQIKAFDVPDRQLANDCYTHNLTKLLTIAGLKQKLTAEEKQNEEFKLNWAIVTAWSEESRYKVAITQQQAQDIFNAITNEKSGILSWLKKFL